MIRYDRVRPWMPLRRLFVRRLTKRVYMVYISTLYRRFAHTFLSVYQLKMSILVSLVCALCITSTHGFHSKFGPINSIAALVYSLVFFDDAEPSYNPCDSKPDVYFYAHPTDINKYYQCDAEGNPYLRSCGTLVWDELSISCNWATSVTLTTTQRRSNMTSRQNIWRYCLVLYS